MDEVDEIALVKINAHLPSEVKPCTEDHFEEVVGFFEETAHNKQPYAAVDSPPVLPLEELEEQFDDTVGPTVRRLAKFVYEHWRSRRLENGNRGLQPNLKVSDTGVPCDENTNKVCSSRPAKTQMTQILTSASEEEKYGRSERLVTETHKVPIN
jgi:enhancer of polycomb-like protein